jgi:hypothetical protein
MEVHELKDHMERQFEAVDKRFEAVDKRFEAVDRRLETVDRWFEAVDRRFDEVIGLILSEGERTRRHFDVVAEQMRSERNLVIDKALAVDQRVGRLTASNAAEHVEFTTRLGDHDQRLAELEPKDKP